MNRERDIERVLDAWLQPGPTVMPDRLFDDVLERIERQPQRRLARLQRRITTMRPITILAAAAALTVAVGTGIVLLNRSPSTDVGGPSPAPGASPRPTPTPRPAPSFGPLETSFGSQAIGYSLEAPAGFRHYPAKEPWNPLVETDMTSPWLERIRTDDNLMTITARSVPLDPPLDSTGWLARFETFPGSPVVGAEPGCAMPATPDWTEVEVDGVVAYQTHEHCGPTWLVLASEGRGYVFTWVISVDDVPNLVAPYDALWERMRSTIDLVPVAADAAAPATTPSP